MEPQPKNKFIIGTIIVCAVLIVLGLLFWWFWPHGSNNNSTSSSGSTTSTTGIKNLSFTTSSYQIALARAVSWESDAVLMTMTSDDSSGQLWNFVFVSQNDKGQALAIAMDGQTIQSADEVVFSGSGAPLPDNIIPPDQALASAHAVPGYATASIESAQLVYDAAAKQWYWGMKTSSGFTISTKATP